MISLGRNRFLDNFVGKEKVYSSPRSGPSSSRRGEGRGARLSEMTAFVEDRRRFRYLEVLRVRVVWRV